MKAIKAIKKMVALGTGIAMVGATIFGAAAADLSDYPSPLFIKNGVFDGIIVVGDNAAGSDVVGSIDVATSMQYSSTTTAQVATGGVAVAPTVSEGVKMERSGNKLNFNETFANIDTKLDKTDLPDVLADGEVDDTVGNNKNDITTTQTITFSGASPILTFANDDDGDEEAGDYILIVDNSNVYKYELKFDSDVKYNNATDSDAKDDLQNVKLSIQGNTYTITDVKLASGKIDEMTMLAGETTVWLEEGVELTKAVAGVSHTVSLQDVNTDQTKCGINVDGTLAWVEKGSTKTVNGVEIGVTDAITVHSEARSEDVCEVNLGASELKLENGQEIDRDGVTVDGSKVEFIETTGGKLKGFNVTYEAQDDEYIGAGKTWVDPVFGNFEISYAGLTYVADMVKASASGSNADIVFNNIDGKEVEIPFVLDDTNDAIIMGEDKDKNLLFSESATTAYDCRSGSATWDDCEGALLWVIDSGEAVRIMQIQDLKSTSSKNETTIKDLTYGNTYTDEISGALYASTSLVGANITAAQITIELGAVGDIKIALNSSGWIVPVDLNLDTANDLPETETGVQVKLMQTNPWNVSNLFVLNFTEDSEETNTDMNLAIKVVEHESDDEINFNDVTVTGAYWSTSNKKESDSNDDIVYGATLAGTMWKYDSEDKQSLDITFTAEQAYGNAFISPVGAEISEGATGTGGSVTTTVVQKIQVGAAKLASEVADVKAVNAIVVGGPCANAAAASLMGNPEKCWEAVPENKAIIKLYQNGAKVALLVAGRTALDTRRASRVLANYQDYALDGMEVEVTGTSLTDITVRAPMSS